MKKDRLIGYSAGIFILILAIFVPFAEVLGIEVPKTVTIAISIFVAVVLISLFGAGLAEDMNINLPKGIIAFVYYIFGFLGGSIVIATYLGLHLAFLFVLFNGCIFYAISTRNK
ncbi:MAG: hypothetical protein GF353_12215 [Candidatus Lokiarchaeota archaeon]|nr:hypothetical protein [Candidatus Lokiarchaeota archaeon]